MNARILICLACIANVAADAQEFRSKVHGAFFGALVADALSLGSHYARRHIPQTISRWAPRFSQLQPGFSFLRIALPFHDRNMTQK